MQNWEERVEHNRDWGALEKDAYKDAKVIRAGTFGEKSSTTLEPDHYKDAAWRYDEARRGGT